MNPPTSLKEMQDQQTVLREEYSKAHDAYYNAKDVYTKKQEALVRFNFEYGRILQMINED